MAIIKFISTVHPQKNNMYGGMKKLAAYILNDSKTVGGKYTGSHNCFVHTACDEMIKTKEHYGKTSPKNSNRLAYHFTISWKPDEKIAYETALKVTEEFCKKYLNEYECVFSVHTDKVHTHSHIMFNSVNVTDGKKYRYSDGDWAKIIQPTVDNICKEHNLRTLYDDTGLTYEEYEQERRRKKGSKNNKQGGNSSKSGEDNRQRRASNNKYYNEKEEPYTNSDMVKADIDEIILNVHSMDEFYKRLAEYGYYVRKGTSVKHGDYFSIKGRGMGSARRNYMLGSAYSIENISKRIDVKNKPLPIMPAALGYKYIINYKYWKKPSYKKELTDFEKREYVRLYQSGIYPKDYYPSYRVIKKHLQAINKIENEIQLIDEYKICDAASADSALEQVNDKLEHLKKKRNEYYMKKKPYIHLLQTYSQMKKHEQGYLLYINGNESCVEDYTSYLECKQIIDKYGFSAIDILSFKESLSIELKNINAELREVTKRYKSLEGIRKELSTDVESEVIDECFSIIPDKYENDEKRKSFQMEQENMQTLDSDELSEDKKTNDITINVGLIEETDSKGSIKTRVPGTWGEQIRYLVLEKEAYKKIHDGKTILTSLLADESYNLYDKDDKAVATILGKEIYRYYDETARKIHERNKSNGKNQLL